MGVGGGAYTGGRAVQVARHRADLRLRLYTEVLERLSNPRILSVELEQVLAEGERLQQLLQLPERELWARFLDLLDFLVANGLPDERREWRSQLLANELGYSGPAEWPPWADPMLRDGLRALAVVGQVLTVQERSIGPFKSYLELRIRPGLVRSTKGRIRAAHLRISGVSRKLGRPYTGHLPDPGSGRMLLVPVEFADDVERPTK